MKKLIALLLSAVLLTTALFTAIPASAETTDTLLATPMVGYTISAPFYWVVAAQSVMPETTKKFVTADGIKLTSATGTAQTFDTAASGQILASAVYAETSVDAAYALPADFATTGSFIIYVKTASANQMYLLVRTECSAQWFSSCVLADNAPYEYLSVGGSAWQSGTATGQAISFDSAFEGYVKIPASSFVNLDGVDMTFGHVSQVSTYFKSIGGEYGDINVGPYFTTTSDSTSTKIEVPEAYQPAPIPATPITGYSMDTFFWDTATHDLVMPKATAKLVNAYGIKMTSYTGAEVVDSGLILASGQFATTPYQMPADFGTKGSLIVYVQTGGANAMQLNMVADCYGGWNTTYKLAANAGYEYLPIGGSEWLSATADGDLIRFASAFEGYVKVPVTAFSSVDGYAIGSGFTKLAQIFAYFKNIGGQYGDITFGPFFTTTADSSSTKFEIPEEYQPAPLNISSFDFKDVRAAAYNFSAGKIENTNNYDLSIDELCWPEEGSVKHGPDVTEWSYVENADGAEGVGGDACMLLPTAVKTYMKDAAGIVFYVEFPKANMFSPCLTFGDQSIMLKPGANVQLLANGSDEWVDKAAIEGYTGNTLIYGVVKFDEAFSGYIKVPMSSLNSDWGWRPVLTGDNMTALTTIAIRFKGIGDAAMYGEHVVAGVSGYYTEDTAKPEIGSIATPAYPTGDANYDWKVNTDDLVDIKKAILGLAQNTGYKVNVIELVKVKKLLAGV